MQDTGRYDQKGGWSKVGGELQVKRQIYNAAPHDVETEHKPCRDPSQRNERNSSAGGTGIKTQKAHLSNFDS